MILHELYFSGLGKGKELDSQSLLYKKIVQDFGSIEAFRKDLVSTGLMRGIGWVVLCQEHKEGKLLNVWVSEHDVGHLAEGSLIIVMDVWEHAYMTVYGLDRAKYIDAFYDNINWEIAEKRFKQSEVSLTLR